MVALEIQLSLRLKQEKLKSDGKNRDIADLFNERKFRVERVEDVTHIYNHKNELVETLGAFTTKEIFKTDRKHYDAIYDYEEDMLTIVKSVSLHGHSSYSVLDCISRPEDIAKKAELAIAVTDHGNMFGALKFYKAMKKVGKKAILGFEAYTSSMDYEIKTVKDDTLHSLSKKHFVSIENLMEHNPSIQLKGDIPTLDVEALLEYLIKKAETIELERGQTIVIPKSNAKNHLVLLAKDTTGYQNLAKLSSIGYDKYTRGRPQIDWKDIREHSEGVVALSACLAGELPRAVLRNDLNQARNVIEGMISIFGKENYYIEIQRHGIEEEKTLNPILLELAKEYDLKVVATNDNHYTNEDDRNAHEAHLAIGTKSELSDPNRWIFPGGGYHIHSSSEMEQLFADLPEVLDNTLDLADKLNAEIPTGNLHMPTFTTPDKDKDEYKYFEDLAWKGFELRFKGTDMFEDEEYRERLQFEIDTINNMKFPGYFLIVADFINYAKRNYALYGKETEVRWKEFMKSHGYSDIPIAVGPGRGSACGSLVAYVLYITNVNPIPYGLLFERFLNPDRISMPDIDTDFPDYRREEVLDYVRDFYGKDSVSGIVTFGTLGPKMVVRDVARVMSYPASFGDKIAKLIPEKVEHNGKTLKITLENVLKYDFGFAQAYKNEKDIQKVVDLAIRLEGLPRNTSVHACFDANTLITTSKGLKRIADVMIGDEVLTHKGRYKKVARLMKTETKKVYTLKTNASFPLEVTGNHPMYVREMSTKRLRKYKEGIDTTERVWGAPNWKPVEELIVNKDYIGIPINKESVIPPYENLKIPFRSESFWWIVGRYIGDGWTETPRNGKAVVICCSKRDETEKEEIVQRLDRVGFSYWISKANTTYKIHIKDCNELFDYLQTFGKYAHGKHLNQDILNLPKELLASFFEGYMSADGHYVKKKNLYSFKTVSKTLAIGMMQVINKVYERPASVYIVPEKDEYIQDRVVHAKEKYEVKFYKTNRKNREKSFSEDGYIWTRVSSIKEESLSKPMYNLTVFDDSSYVVHGLAAHNCGYIIAPGSVSNYIPQTTVLNKDTKERDTVTQFDMNECEEVGLLKMDFLGLRTMGVIDIAIQDANEKRKANGQDLLNSDNLSDKARNDVNVYDFISKGNTAGLFQLESAGMTDLMKQLFHDVSHLRTKKEDVTKELFERLVAGISLYRPGPMDEIPNYLQNLSNPHTITYDSEQLKDILSATYNVIVYQEQVMFIVRELAGFTRGQSDTIRKAMGKKQVELIDEYEDYFLYGDKEMGIRGCQALGIEMELAKDIWERMKKFALYAFNKSHAVGYADVSVMTAYLSYHYPVEMMSAILNSYKSNADRIKQFIGVSKQRGIDVLSPNVNASLTSFSVEKEAILFGFNGLKNMGKSGELIILEREERGEFLNLFDFVERMITHQRLDKRMMESLVYSGTLDGFAGSRKEKLEMLDWLLGISSVTKEHKKENELTFFHADSFYPTKTMFIEPRGTGELGFHERLMKEKEYTGFYVTGHPIEQYIPILNQINVDALNKVSSFLSSDDEAGGSGAVAVKEQSVRTKLVGVVQEVKVFYTKKGDLMASYEIEDETGSIRAVVFPNEYINYSKVLVEGNVLAFDGFVEESDFGTQFLTSAILTVEELAANTEPLRLELTLSESRTTAKQELMEIDNILNDNSAVNTIPIVFNMGNQSFSSRKGTTIYGNTSIKTTTKLQSLLGMNNVQVIY